jgi:hypothetical protein
MPRRPKSKGYVRPPREDSSYVPDHAAKLIELAARRTAKHG